MAKFMTTQSDLKKFNGLKIIGIKPLDEKEYDKADVGLMFTIMLENGATFHAFVDEIVED